MDRTCERLVLGGSFSPDIEEEHLERYKYASAFAKDADVIDIASGSGYGSKMLADAGARSVRAFDVSAQAVQYASDHYQADQLSFALGDAEALSGVADSCADLVVSFETIEHLRHVDKYLDEMQRILRPGGQFIVSTPDRRLASTLYPLRGKPNNEFHVEEFTDTQLRRMLEPRFEITDFAGQNYVSRPLVFWPLQVSLKASAYALRRFGAYTFIRNTYHLGSGFQVKSLESFKGSIPRFWVIRCRKVK